MPVLLRIAFRNLLEHRSKSIIIGSIIALGVFVIIIGNAMMDQAEVGLRKDYIDNYTADIMVSGISKEGDVSLFGVMSMSAMMEKTPVVPEHEKIRTYVQSLPQVKAVTSQASTYGLLTVREDDNLEDGLLVFVFGIEPSSYQQLFSNLKITSGTYLKPGQSGVMLPNKRIADIKKKLNMDVGIGSKIRIMSATGNFGSVSELTIVGTYDTVDASEGGGMMCYADIKSVRELYGMTVSVADEKEFSKQSLDLLKASDEASLFSDDMFEEPTMSDTPIDKTALAAAAAAKAEAKAGLDDGTYHGMLIRLKDSRDTQYVVDTLNAYFTANDIPAIAGDWKKAAGPDAMAVDVIRIIFNIAILILAIVAVIIMMNTLVISVIERTGEIGTMRALGARKGFVWKMFFTETLTLTIVFGIIGIIISVLAVIILNFIGIEAPNGLFKVLFGGNTLHLSIGLVSVVQTFLMVGLVSLLAHLYPVAVALRVPPVRAIQTE